MEGGSFGKLNINENSSDTQNPEPFRNDQDLRVAYGGEFIYPSQAKGQNIHELQSGEVTIPVVFETEAGRFRVSGIQDGTNEGIIISGIFSPNAVKINHVVVAENLRRTGMGAALLTDLENQLKERHIGTAYATFGKTDTVDFFLKNGYRPLSINSLNDELKTQLDIGPDDIETEVNTAEDFQNLKMKLKENPEYDSRQVLLMKNLES